MSTVLDELADYLATQLSLVVGTDIFRHQAPATPDAILTLYETGGPPSELGLGVAGVNREYPSVQVVCRGARNDWDTPRATAESAYTALAQVQAQTLGSTAYLLIRPLNPPSGVLGKDEQDRPRVSFNVSVEKELSA